MVTPVLSVSPDCTWAAAPASEPSAATNRTAARISCLPPTRLRNLYPGILRRKFLAFGVAHYQPHQIRAWLHVEVGVDSHRRPLLQPAHGFVAQTKLQHLLLARYEIAIGVEHRGYDSHIVAVPVVRFAQVDLFQV